MGHCTLLHCRDGCEELRSILSKRHQDDVCHEREEQIRVKREQQYRQHKGAHWLVVMFHIHTFIVKCLQ